MQLSLISRLIWQEIRVNNCDLFLRAPLAGDFEQWVELRTQSQAFLRPWEPQWPEDDLSKLGYKRRLKAYSKQRQSGSGQTYFLFNDAANQIIGGISLTRISHGIVKSASLGYWMGEKYAGQGHMQKAVPAILNHAFKHLKLNRVEAACIPKNACSKHLLLKCGFNEEGFAQQYLEINGRSEDHILFAILADEFNKQYV